MIGVVKIGYERSIKDLEWRSKGWGRNIRALAAMREAGKKRLWEEHQRS